VKLDHAQSGLEVRTSTGVSAGDPHPYLRVFDISKVIPVSVPVLAPGIRIRAGIPAGTHSLQVPVSTGASVSKRIRVWQVFN
jgi:hypothetical protein